MSPRLVLVLFALLGWSQDVARGDEPNVAKVRVPSSQEDDKEGWVSLFDGKSLKGWVTGDGKPVTSGWEVDNGLLHCPGRVGSIYPVKQYGDFELEFEWRIAKGGNAGIKYRMVHYEKGLFGRSNSLGCEYQILDDFNRKVDPKNQTASIYDLIAPRQEKKLLPHDEFNTGRIVANGPKIEHWLNGERVVEADLTSDEWKAQVAKSKFGEVEGFFTSPKGKIQLQDHGNKVWFRTIKIREIEPAPGE
jgi:hypothetical protein